ncbi:MAG: hypothetical protein ACYTFI_00815 [Planctomycetota bacterium]|jgi:hypothetical protein
MAKRETTVKPAGATDVETTPLTPMEEFLERNPQLRSLNPYQIEQIMSGRWPMPGASPTGTRLSQQPGGPGSPTLPMQQVGLESLRRLHGVLPEATGLAGDIVGGIEGSYQAPPGTFAEAEGPAIEALKTELRGDVTPRERADIMGDVMSRFRQATGAIHDERARAGGYVPGSAATAAAGEPSAELATGLGKAAVGLERLGSERRARALSTAGRYLPEITGPRKAFGAFVGEAGKSIPVLGAGGGSGVPGGGGGAGGFGPGTQSFGGTSWASPALRRRYPGMQAIGQTSTGGYITPGQQYVTYGQDFPRFG